MSDVDKVTEAVNNIAQAFSDLHGGSELHEEIARLKAKSAMQAGEITKLLTEKANLKERTEKDAKLIQHLYGRIDEANETTEQFKKAAEDLNKKFWDEREMGAEAGAEMAKLREKVKKLEKERRDAHNQLDYAETEHTEGAHELKAKLERMQSANDTLAKSNSDLRAQNEDLVHTNRRNAEYNHELRDIISDVEQALSPLNDDDE